MMIVSVQDLYTAAAGSAEELARIRCRIEPQLGAEEEWVARVAQAGRRLGVWPSFGARDGVVILDRSESRWFLAGREIRSVECW